MSGQTIQVVLNGVVVNEFLKTDPNCDLSRGFLGIQNHGTDDQVFYRNIQIKELGGAP